MSERQDQYFGKYRGTVVNNIDPKQLGRIQVSVPAVLGDGFLSWAMPSVPYAGRMVGFFAVPPMGANVWVEFEAGDPERPIWSGCFWGLGEVPALPALAEVKVFKTDWIKLEMSDLPGIGGFTLEVLPPAVPTPMSLTFNAQGIEIKTVTGSVKLTPATLELSQTPASVSLSPVSINLANGAATVDLSPVSVSINGGALEVI